MGTKGCRNLSDRPLARGRAARRAAPLRGAAILGILSTVLALTACSFAARESSPPTSPTAAALDQEAIAALDVAFDEGFASSRSAGATVGLWIPGQGEWVASRGVADLATGEPMDPAMQQPIGSVTKTYTALIALQLVSAGALELDDTLDAWYPDYPEAAAITIRMLLNHSTGVAEFSQPQLDLKCADPQATADPDELIAISAELPRADFAPGEGYQYSTANTIIVGRILERVTGIGYEALLAERLFEPLEVTRTILYDSGMLEAPFAHGYTDFCVPQLAAGTDTSSWPMLAFAGGGLASTIDDLHRYGVGFGEGIGLSEAMRDARLSDTAEGDDTSGLGLVIQRDPGSGETISIGHAGSEPGYGANLAYYPCSGAVFAALVNDDADPALIEILTAVVPLAQELATRDCERD